MRRELIATIGNEERTVIVEHSVDTDWHVVIDGVEHTVDAKKLRPGTWSLIIAGRSYLVDFEDSKRGTTARTPRGEAALEVEDARHKRLTQAVAGKSDAGSRGEVICAPIAGKVVKLVVAIGDTVELGQVVCVLEAMKMENEIAAEAGGVVEAIHVEPGIAVDTFDKLVTLVAATES